MLDGAGQAGVQITEEMINAGRDALLRELTHPEREDINRYKAEKVAAMVFRSMSAIWAEETARERPDLAVEINETI